MLITRDFVFVHLPKTGGTFIQKVCRENMPIERKLRDHLSVLEIPPEYAHLPIFATIRNPWDWYVSWHHFQAGLPEPDPTWAKFSSSGRLGFELTVTRACGKAIDSPVWLIEALQRRDWDYYTFWWWTTYGGPGRRGPQIDVGRQESLREDFTAFLDRHSIPGDELRKAVASEPPFNVTERGEYRDYYNDELRELVERKSRRLIGEYGYSF
jgi:hypothetical protein